MMEEKYDAVCCECGKPCQVPFKPKNPKTVKCKDCYNAGVVEDKNGAWRADTKKIMAGCVEDAGIIVYDHNKAELRDNMEGNNARPLLFDHEDLRSMTLSLFIARTKG